MPKAVIIGKAGARHDAKGRRLCASPGCTYFDFHNGACSNAQPLEKRPRYVPPPPRPKPPPRTPNPEKKRKRPEAPPDPIEEPPAVQAARADGLRHFYHVHRWGLPLPDGPVEARTGNASDDEADETWRLDETARRTCARKDVSAADAHFMELWNGHVQRLTVRLVSDRMLPAACRSFARAHADALRRGARLHRCLREHLRVLWEHNLLHRDDVHDCLVLVGTTTDDVLPPSVCNECARPLHESHCALAARVRGAAAWPSSEARDDEFRKAAVLAGGVWQVSAAEVESGGGGESREEA